MAEYSDYVEGRTNASALDGSELIAISQGGSSRKTTLQDVANLGGGGGTSIPYGVTSGTNTYTIAATPAVTAYTDGMLLHIRVGNSSTSLVTLNFDSVGAKKLFDTAGTQAQDGYLKAGVDYLVVYNAALDGAVGGFTVVNELVHGVMNLRGTFVSAGGGVWPTGAGSGPSGGIRHGDVFVMGDADTLGAKTVNAGDFITTTVDAPGQTDSNWFVIPGPASLALKQTLINAAVAITDAASMDLTAIKHTLATSSATRTFTISYTGDDITLEVTLSATSSVFTFPATALCVSDGVASGDNTCSLLGASGDKYIIAIKKIGSAYYVISKNFGQ